MFSGIIAGALALVVFVLRALTNLKPAAVGDGQDMLIPATADAAGRAGSR